MFVLLGAVSLVFLILRLVPGDPAILILGVDASPDALEALRERLGLDKSLLEQYIIYLGGVLRLDFGASLQVGGQAMALVVQRVPASLVLASSALVFAVAVGIPMGIAAALRPNGAADRLISLLSLVAQSAPPFWVGIVFILIFARALGWLPSAGNASVRHIILPAITLSLPYLALLVRLTRSGLLEVINEGYIQTARAKGLKEWNVILPHALRNALIPILTVVGLQFGTMLGGAVIVETVFAWPGVGRLLIDSISSRDYGVVQASVLLITAGFVLVNLAVDLLYGYIDPRVRLERA